MAEAYEHFDRAVKTYNEAAELQAQVARNLARYLPNFNYPTILEIGCGTGLMTRELARVYNGEARYILSDYAEQKLVYCREHFSQAASYIRMDGERPTFKSRSFDLIVSNMTAQWFKKPVTALSNLQRFLKPGGILLYSTITRDNFSEWREHLNQRGIDCGMRDDLPVIYPGQFRQYTIPRNYGSGKDFFKMLKDTGADKPKEGYVRPPPKALIEARDSFDGRIKWQIVYGLLHSLHNGRSPL